MANNSLVYAGRWTAEYFDAVDWLKYRKGRVGRISDVTKRRLRSVLVDGVHVDDVAEREGVNRSIVFAALKQWVATVENPITIPDTWKAVTVTVPPDKAELIRQIEKDALATLAKPENS